MRTENLARAQLLIQQDRFDQAEGELRLHLTGDPENGYAHALLAFCLLRLQQLDPAEASARTAVTLEPAASFHHRILGLVLLTRNRLDDATRAIDEALRLNPIDSDLFALRGMIALHRYRWDEALRYAQQGLEHEPDNLDCINLQAQALVKLGRQEEAAKTLGGALAQAPDNSYTHANQGWALLHRNQHQPALEHFREALRLDPENEFARAGMVEALKARNIVYRGMLSFFLWMSRLPPGVQTGIVIGGLVGQRALSQIARTVPGAGVFVWPIIIAYVVFAVMTWIADPLFNLLLRIDRFGRHALSPDQRIGSTVFGLDLLLAMGGALGLVACFLLNAPLVAVIACAGVAIVFGLALIPVSGIWKCPAGWPRWTMGLYTLGLIFVGLSAFAAKTGLVLDEAQSDAMLATFFIGVFISQFMASGLLFGAPAKVNGGLVFKTPSGLPGW